ncbi:uncharacterized protein TRIADDRAFT_61208 [Trichoplax adhaerens]|uniref:RRM domain-containing protein n=1 Tax=Trichoplax adhaerens TaxID=10228 RepID=B3SAC0_TRIAD|nr:hypothetical protein TRIADDRAFT_61208 [Trichoplax adhaerens]EDV20233.1 hypothetical protein TRIADDRAFT_61208 [Trichoplax adhaerens]|eukprot:XP_002117183.1 hypothetical protein TRIADDRAFT_61208 [Trichoplax adhaerens]
MFASYVDKARSLFVARLPWFTSPEILRQYFSKYGIITRASIVYDRDTGRSRRYGFVEFRSRSSLQQALTEQPHVIDGTEALVKEVLTQPSEPAQKSGLADEEKQI